MPKDIYLSLCLELPTGTLPSKIKLIPRGVMVGNDKRQFINNSPDLIVAAFNADPRDIALDVEHATELLAPKGEPAPAQGWFTQLEVIDGEVWGALTLNEDGEPLIRKRNYRYVSPAFHHDAQGNILALSSVGLTNKPNLNLPSLNRQKENKMPIPILLATALALNADASENDALTAINKLKSDNQALALNAQQPSLDKFVPVETHNLALNRAKDAEQALESIEKGKMTAAVDAAIKGGKIAPANKEMFVALCQQQGLDKFNAYIDASPAIVSTKTKAPKTPAQSQSLTESELAMCQQMGLSKDEFLAAKGDE